MRYAYGRLRQRYDRILNIINILSFTSERTKIIRLKYRVGRLDSLPTCQTHPLTYTVTGGNIKLESKTGT